MIELGTGLEILSLFKYRPSKLHAKGLIVVKSDCVTSHVRVIHQCKGSNSKTMSDKKSPNKRPFPGGDDAGEDNPDQPAQPGLSLASLTAAAAMASLPAAMAANVGAVAAANRMILLNHQQALGQQPQQQPQQQGFDPENSYLAQILHFYQWMATRVEFVRIGQGGPMRGWN